MGDLDKAINSASPDQLRQALSVLLAQHMSPVFGAAKLVEHEIAALTAMQVIEFVARNPDDFDLMERLGISKTKARNLLLQQALREQPSPSERRAKLVLLVSELKFHDRKNETFMIEVADPYMMEVLKKEIRSAGQISVPTLSPSVISINRATVPVLFDRLLDKATKQEVLKRYEAENGTGMK